MWKIAQPSEEVVGEQSIRGGKWMKGFFPREKSSADGPGLMNRVMSNDDRLRPIKEKLRAGQLSDRK
jgi:hypothetical protein